MVPSTKGTECIHMACSPHAVPLGLQGLVQCDWFGHIPGIEVHDSSGSFENESIILC